MPCPNISCLVVELAAFTAKGFSRGTKLNATLDPPLLKKRPLKFLFGKSARNVGHSIISSEYYLPLRVVVNTRFPFSSKTK